MSTKLTPMQLNIKKLNVIAQYFFPKDANFEVKRDLSNRVPTRKANYNLSRALNGSTLSRPISKSGGVAHYIRKDVLALVEKIWEIAETNKIDLSQARPEDIEIIKLYYN